MSREFQVSRGATRRTFVVDDPSEKTFTIATEQDCSAITDRNKRLQNELTGYSPSRELRWAASIPNIFLEKWLKEEGLRYWDKDHWPALKRKLNDPDFRHFRTSIWNL